MPFELLKLLEERHGENFELHERYLNPKLTKVVTTLGFDRFYQRGEGCYLYDEQGMRYLDLLSGFGVFALGRSHPVVKDALRQALDADLPNMVQLDCALLPGLLAEQLVTRSPKQIERAFFCNSGAEAVATACAFVTAAVFSSAAGVPPSFMPSLKPLTAPPRSPPILRSFLVPNTITTMSRTIAQCQIENEPMMCSWYLD